jgi:signal transduction histidine kinase
MKGRLATALSPRYAGVLAFALSVSMAVLGLFAYRAIREWQSSATLVAERRAQEAADLLANALRRDMRAVQASILSSQDWDELTVAPPYDVVQLVAIAFARYPYPELFFAWGDVPPAEPTVFFGRADRVPGWLPPSSDHGAFPVLVAREPDMGRRLMERIALDASYEHTYSIFDLHNGATPYQVVARLRYADAYRTRLSGVLGFMVNLDWAKEHYLRDLAGEVERVRSDAVRLSAVPQRVAADRALARAPLVRGQRSFPLLFFDPLSLAVTARPDLSREVWVAEAVLSDDGMRAASAGAQRALIITALAGAVFAVGLALAVNGVRVNAALVKRRVDFVSSVTHELKTPVATIRAAGETLITGRLASAEVSREYARLVVEQAKRLTRLVNNLLAYSRITDTTEGYSFEAHPLDVLVEESLRDWKWQLQNGGFDVTIDVPSDLPPVRADRTAFELLLDNLIANAIAYSTERRAIRIVARALDGAVMLEVADRGIGIPADELAQVTRRFFRGRRSNPGGSGLGLAIVERIITDHGGTLAFESVVDAGTTVRVTLPIEETDT